MNANYRHILVFAETDKAEVACKWVQDHVDLSNQHSLADCKGGQDTSLPEVVFYTESMLSHALIQTILMACQPETNGELLPGHAVFNIDEHNEHIVPSWQETGTGNLSNYQRAQDEKRQPASKWVPLKVHDNTVDIAIQRLQATVDQYQHYLRALDELLAMTHHREFGSREATAYLHNFVQGQVGREHEDLVSKILAARWEIIQLSTGDEKSQWPHYKVEYGFASDPFADAQVTYIPVKMVERFGGVAEAFTALGLLQNGDGEKAILIGDVDTISLYTPDCEEYIVPTHDFEWASFFTGGEAPAGDSSGNFDSCNSEIVQVPDDLLDRIEESSVTNWEEAAKIAFEQWCWISRIHLVSQNTGGDSSERCGNGVTQPELAQQQCELRTWAEKHAQECKACLIVQQREKNSARS